MVCAATERYADRRRARRVDESRDHNERPLEEVLVGLRQAEKCHRTENFGQQHRDHDGAYERPSPARLVPHRSC